MSVIVVGSLNVDLCIDVERLPAPGETVLGGDLRRHPGGKGLNQAIAAARMGADVRLVGCVGDDADGRWLRSLLEDEGVDASHVATAPPGVATGTALITVDRVGTGQITVAPGANATLAVHRLAAGTGDVVLAQLEIPMDAVAAAIAAASAAGATTMLNPAPARPLDASLRSRVDILVPNEHEAASTGLGASHTVVTRGAAGAIWHHGDEQTDIAPFAVDAVDTTAAGDAFCGALAAALASGLELPDGLRRASAAGAITVTRRGAATSLPMAAEVDALLERQRP